MVTKIRNNKEANKFPSLSAWKAGESICRWKKFKDLLLEGKYTATVLKICTLRTLLVNHPDLS